MRLCTLLLGLLLLPALAAAAPAVYDVDPDHTHPLFEADHFNGVSVWRGLFRKSRGSVTLDKAAGTGTVDIHVDTASVITGLDKLDQVLVGKDYFDSAEYPEAHFTGTLGGFKDGAPTVVDGRFTLRGVTKPMRFKVLSFKCVPHPLYKRDWCGADVLGSFDRSDFGMDAGKDWGFRMGVTLRIQVEAVARK